ncbi:MAG TPA: TonB-dependent receptor [Gemmatimonadota bacterium]|nr:TonB-dependent receptor [Gemmatimonadota bacterium]
MPRLALLSIPLFLAVLATPLAAQEEELQPDTVLMETIQAVATRTERATFDVPVPVDVLEGERIDRLQADNVVADLFPLEAGLEVEGEGPFLGLPVLRGLSGNRVLVLVDGQRLNNSREAINFGGVQPGLVDVSSIASIEIVRGPASVLYGSDAIGGIVNIVTRRPELPAEGLAVSGSATTRYSTADRQRTGALALHVGTPTVGLAVRGSARDADDYASALGDVSHSGAETRSAGADLEWRPADDHALTLQWSTLRGEDIGVPGSGGVFTGFYPRTDRSKFAVGYEGRDLAPWLARLDARVYAQDQDEVFATILDLPPIPAGPFDLLIDTTTERTGEVRTTGLDVQAGSPIEGGHYLTYGIDLFRDDVDEQRREESVQEFVPRAPGPPGSTETVTDDTPTTPESSYQGMGVYLQDEISAGRWTLIPGARVDRFDIEAEALEREEGAVPAEDRTESALSGSFAALFRAADWLHLTGSVGRAFRTPNVIERFFFGPGSQGGLSVPNPDLENETSVNVDVGFKARAAGMRVEATYFHNRIDDFITFVPGTFMGESEFGGQPVTTVGNVGEARIRGLEAEVEHRGAMLGGMRTAFAAFSWNDGDDLTEDDPLFVPPLKLAVGLGWTEGSGRVSGLVTGRFVDGQSEVPEGFEPTSGFAVFDLHAAADLSRLTGRPLVLRAGVENLLDRAYEEPYGAALAPGRNLVLSLEAGFGDRDSR